MATYTPNLNLKKPDYTDLADVADFNANMDIIDGLTQDDIPDGTTNKAYTATEKNKLAGIETGANNYTHPTTAGNKHIPTGGSVGQILRNTASGTVGWSNTATDYSATITTTWTGSSAPFTQNVTVSGITANDVPFISPVYSTDNATAILQKEAWNMISKAITSTNVITFTCFEEKPVTAIPIQIRVVR